MKKFVSMTAMLALMLVAAVPAFAADAVGGDIDRVDSDQVQASLTIQRNSDNDQDLAGVAQSLDVEQDQVLAAGTDANVGTFFWF